MEKMFISIICILFLQSASASADDDTVSVLINHIERLDAKIEQLEEKHGAEIEALKENAKFREAELVHEIQELDQRVSSLEEKNNALKKANYRFRSKMFKDVLRKTNTDNFSDSKAALDLANDAEKTIEKKNVSKIRSRNVEIDDAVITKPKRALQMDYNIAFSAYMDHDADRIGVGQTIKHNQIFLNDGNGYNRHSGVFTAPIAGVYSFTFFIGQRGAYDAGMALFVNSVNQVDAIAETHQATEDAMGGNSVVLKVSAGDVVYIKSLFGVHLEGSSTFRLTTFSGFLLYPTEVDGPTVVGK